MALSEKSREILIVALADEDYANEIADAIDAVEGAFSTAASAVTALGTTANLVGVDGTGSNAAPLVETEARLDVAEAKVDEIISALKAAGLMAS